MRQVVRRISDKNKKHSDKWHDLIVRRGRREDRAGGRGEMIKFKRKRLKVNRFYLGFCRQGEAVFPECVRSLGQWYQNKRQSSDDNNKRNNTKVMTEGGGYWQYWTVCLCQLDVLRLMIDDWARETQVATFPTEEKKRCRGSRKSWKRLRPDREYRRQESSRAPQKESLARGVLNVGGNPWRIFGILQESCKKPRKMPDGISNHQESPSLRILREFRTNCTESEKESRKKSRKSQKDSIKLKQTNKQKQTNKKRKPRTSKVMAQNLKRIWWNRQWDSQELKQQKERAFRPEEFVIESDELP